MEVNAETFEKIKQIVKDGLRDIYNRAGDDLAAAEKEIEEFAAATAPAVETAIRIIAANPDEATHRNTLNTIYDTTVAKLATVANRTLRLQREQIAQTIATILRTIIALAK